MSFPALLSDRLREKARQLKLKTSDVTEQFIRGGGHGGQKINKTSNCVFLLHRPTGLMVKCQAYRERERNRAEAYRRLIDKIDQAVRGAQSERAKNIHRIRKQKQKRSRRAKEKMLGDKKRVTQKKRLRRQVSLEE